MTTISRAWYNDSYTVAAKPIKSFELHYTMIQFLRMLIIRLRIKTTTIGCGHTRAIDYSQNSDRDYL